MKIIAVDFDGTLCENAWPRIGKACWPIIHALKRRQAAGDKIILWTCRCDAMLDEAVLWCLNHGLKFDAINDNLPENIEKYNNNCRKVFADEYWDDKSVIISVERVPSILRKNGDGGFILHRTQDAQLGIRHHKPTARKRLQRWWRRCRSV